MSVRRVTGEQPPANVGIELREWLARQFASVNAAFQSTADFTPVGQIPDKPRNGDAYYFNVVTGPITSKGPWMYVEGTWRKLTV